MWIEHQKIQSGSEMSIINRLIPNAEDIATENRDYFSLIFKYIKSFLSNELAMRNIGEHDSESQHQENWKTFIKLQLDTNPTFKNLHQKMLSKHLSTVLITPVRLLLMKSLVLWQKNADWLYIKKFKWLAASLYSLMKAKT